MVSKLALLYGYPAAQAERLTAALTAAGVPARAVPYAAWGQAVRAVLALREPETPYTGPLLPEPVLILHGLKGPSLDRALKAVRESGVPASLKAVTTPTNLAWPPAEFYRHLTAERDYFRRQR